MFSTERLLQLRDMEKFLKGVFRDASSILMSRAVQGDDVPGFKLVKAVGNRKWKDEGKVRDMLEGMGIDESSFTHEPKLYSPAKIKTLVKEVVINQLSLGASPNKVVKAEVKDRQAKMEELTDRPDNGVKLVPDGAPGVPVLPETFNDIEE